MAKAIRYTFPDEHAPTELKIIQEAASSIKGFYFSAGRLTAVSKEEGTGYYAVYFLFDSPAPGQRPRVYIGQSRNGITRINQHKTKKDFWTHCLMFISENNSFDANAIDFMEHHFIHRFKDADRYELENCELRDKAPNVSSFDKVAYTKYIAEIEFLLRAEGVPLPTHAQAKPRKAKSPANKDASQAPEKRYYRWIGGRGFAELYQGADKYFIERGALLPPLNPPKKQVALHERIQSLRLKYLAEGLLATAEEGGYRSLEPIAFNSPSAAAQFLCGRSSNGWTSFEGLTELRPALGLAEAHDADE